MKMTDMQNAVNPYKSEQAATRVLVLEDEAVVLTQLEMRLSSMGFDVVGTASTAAEAVELAERANPDILLADIVMAGEMDGLDAAAIISSRKGIPIILISGYPMQDFIDRAALIKAESFILKPFDEKSIKAAIDLALKRRTLAGVGEEWKRLRAKLEKTISDSPPEDEGLLIKRLLESLRDHLACGELMLRLKDDVGCPVKGSVSASPSGPGLPENADLRCLIAPAMGCICDRVTRFGVSRVIDSEKTLQDLIGNEFPHLPRCPFLGGMGAMAAMPLMHSGKAIGCLMAADPTNGFFGSENLDLLSRAARFIGEKLGWNQAIRGAERSKFLASIGDMAGGIAHGFNNALTSILGSVTLAMDLVPEGSEIGEILSEAVAAAMKANDLTAEFMTFSKGGAPARAPVDLAEAISDAFERYKGASRTPGLIEFDAPADTMPVLGDKRQITIAVGDIIRSGRTCSKPGTGLKIGRILEGGMAGFSVSFTPGENFLGEADFRIFTPFHFSTHRGGSGFGLSRAYSIARRHGGSLTVSGNSKSEVILTLLLPAAAGAKRLPVPAAISPGSTASSETGETIGSQYRGRVLVVDDDEQLGATVCRMLQKIGFKADLVTCSKKGISRYMTAMASKEPYAAVIMDLVLPESLPGEEAARQILNHHPEARIIASSGYSDSEVLSDHGRFGFSASLPKPYTLRGLKKIMGSVVEDKI